jgi:hypothetical protein
LESVSIGAPLLKNMEGRSLPRAFERRDNFLYSGNIFMANLRGMYKRPCKTVSSLHRGPVGEPGVVFFTGTFEKKKENSYMGFFS